jgi:hypothetical protein
MRFNIYVATVDIYWIYWIYITVSVILYIFCYYLVSIITLYF